MVRDHLVPQPIGVFINADTIKRATVRSAPHVEIWQALRDSSTMNIVIRAEKKGFINTSRGGGEGKAHITNFIVM